MSFLVYVATLIETRYNIRLKHMATTMSCLTFFYEVDKRQCLFGTFGNWAGMHYNITQKHMGTTMSCLTFS